MDNIARSWAVALGERDNNTLLHSDRVVRLAAEIGSHLNLSERELEVLAMGAQFHDIGKIGIPDNVLGKPAAFDRLSSAQLPLEACVPTREFDAEFPPPNGRASGRRLEGFGIIPPSDVPASRPPDGRTSRNCCRIEEPISRSSCSCPFLPLSR